ncbi:hypothetical protein GCM10027048_28400 [Hymenobacter coalescens]
MSTSQELTAKSAALEAFLRDYRVIVAENPALRSGLSFEAYLVYATAERRDKELREQLQNVIHLLNRMDK